MAEIEKNKIQVYIKVENKLCVPEVSDLSINITNSHNFHLGLPEELIEQALRSFAHPYKSNIYLRVRFVS